ncbi:hypothetical protein CPB83DRAFT_863053 [Crepidotus variabilis]|uniref:Uncharacterized protein n=1 Tax=Crepidotus variabilis TaxID=179855 RepID=A0A9P6E689_9AGAR|nr:hypothetical protein CPB83DRAFT_863053 [Crepidotus variabilis]
MREIYSRDLHPQHGLNVTQRLSTPPPAIKVPKPLNLFGPLSPLSELTPSEDEGEPLDPISKQDDTIIGKPCNSETSEASTKSSLIGKRKRSSSVTSIASISDEPPSKRHASARQLSPSPDNLGLSVDAVHTPKRRKGSSNASSEHFTEVQAGNSRSLTPVEVRQSLRRHAKTFGRIRKSKSAPKQQVIKTQ